MNVFKTDRSIPFQKKGRYLFETHGSPSFDFEITPIKGQNDRYNVKTFQNFQYLQEYEKQGFFMFDQRPCNDPNFSEFIQKVFKGLENPSCKFWITDMDRFGPVWNSVVHGLKWTYLPVVGNNDRYFEAGKKVRFEDVYDPHQHLRTTQPTYLNQGILEIHYTTTAKANPGFNPSTSISRKHLIVLEYDQNKTLQYGRIGILTSGSNLNELQKDLLRAQAPDFAARKTFKGTKSSIETFAKALLECSTRKLNQGTLTKSELGYKVVDCELPTDVFRD